MGGMSPAGGRGLDETRRRALLAGLAAALLLALAVVGSRPSVLGAGDGAANAGPLVAAVHAVEIVGLGLQAALVVLLVVLLRPARRSGEEEPEAAREATPVPWWVRLVVALVPLLALGALVWAVLHLRSGTTPAEAPMLVPPAPMAGESAQAADPTGLAGWEYLLAGLLGVAVVAEVLRQLFRRPEPGFVEEPPEDDPRTRALATAVVASLDDARQEEDPRQAVIAAYATMERVLAEQGLPRRESEATLEYMERLFGELPVGRDAVATLTRLFEVARFSLHEVPPAAKAQAILALVGLRDALGDAA